MAILQSFFSSMFSFLDMKRDLACTAPAAESCSSFIGTHFNLKLAVSLFCLYWGISSMALRSRIKRVANAPVHGYRLWLEPSILLKMRFMKNSRQIISSGYEKYKHRPFVVLRNDIDITVLPNKYLPELRLAPATKLNRSKAIAAMLGDRWITANVWDEATVDVAVRTISENLIAQLPQYLEDARIELDVWWDVEVPKFDDWTEVDIQHVVHVLVARSVGKLLIGSPASQSPEWLEIAGSMPPDIVTAATTIKMLPPWTHLIITHLLPARFRMKRSLRRAAELVVRPAMEMISNKVTTDKAQLEDGSFQGQEGENQKTLLRWMMDHVDDDENDRLSKMTRRVVFMSFVSTHTTSMAICDILFDLCAHPEFAGVLREEATNVTDELGPMGGRTGTKQWLGRLEKLDSFYVESQRFNYPGMLLPNRLAMETITLHDGLQIPKGSLVSWAAYHHRHDATISPDPQLFDPMRNYRKRHSSTEQFSKNLAGQTDRDNLAFGYGSQACPGRHFAVSMIKMVVSKLLMDLEFKLPDGQARPSVLTLGDMTCLDPSAKILMRTRQH